MAILPVRKSASKNLSKNTPRAALVDRLRGDLALADQMANRIIERLNGVLDGDKPAFQVLDAVYSLALESINF